MEKELNNIFENIHPLLKINFENIGENKFKVSIDLHDEKGKFRTGTSQELTYSFINDSRFLTMVKGSAKALKTIFSTTEITNLLDSFSPSELIIEYVLNDKSLNTIEDFELKLNSFSARTYLLSQEYIFQEIDKLGIDIQSFNENEIQQLVKIGSFELAFTMLSSAEYSNIVNILVENPNSWLLFVKLIKNWAKASNWSCNEAWKGGPLIEELMAFYAFVELSKKTDVKKQEWWSNLYIMVDMCLEFSDADLKKAGFLVG